RLSSRGRCRKLACIAGLGPAMHRPSQEFSKREDGSSGQAVQPQGGDSRVRGGAIKILQKLLNSVVPLVTSGSAKKHSNTSGSLPVLRVICFSFGGISTISPGLIGVSPLSATVVPVPLST